MMKNGTLFRNVEKNCFDFETRLDEMEKCKVNVQAVSTVPVMFHYWVRFVNHKYNIHKAVRLIEFIRGEVL